MYDYRKCVMGLAPTRRDAFKANRKAEIDERIKALAKKLDVELVTIDDVATDGLVTFNKDVPKIAKKFIDAGVDCVFFPHANFGQEEAVAKVGKAVGKPILLWGPRDDAPKGVVNQMEDRLYDVQCGLFATGKALLSYQLPFTYLENCWMDSDVLDRGFEDFVRTVCAARAVTQARIAQLSVRPWQFLSVRANENELVEKFGIEVVPLGAPMILHSVNETLKKDAAAVDAKIAEWKAKLDFSQMDEEDVRKTAAAVVAIRNLAEQNGCTTVAGECWMLLRSEFGINSCYAWGALTNEGLPTTCETDVLGTVGSAMMLGATRKETIPFFADITVRHPTNDNAELLWHCGPFPASLAKPQDGKPAVIGGKGQWE